MVILQLQRKCKKNSLEDFININNSGKITVDQDDKIIGVKICKRTRYFTEHSTWQMHKI